MSWANAFDIGPCTLYVLNTYYPLPSYSGVLGKGQSANFYDSYSGSTLNIAVSSSGVVILSWVSGNPVMDSYSLKVSPLYALNNAIQVSGISMPNGVSGLAKTQSSDISTPVFLYTLDGVNWTPDPAVITDLPNQSYFSVYMGQLV